MKVKFTRTSKYKSVNPAGHLPGQLSYSTTTYEAGKTYDLSDDQAGRWIRRGAAEATTGRVDAESKALTTPKAEDIPRPEITAGSHLKTASAK